MYSRKIITGSIFIIFSGIFYEIDKALNYYKWATNVLAINGNGGYNSEPDPVKCSDNHFIVLFLIIGILFFVSAAFSYYKQLKK